MLSIFSLYLAIYIATSIIQQLVVKVNYFCDPSICNTKWVHTCFHCNSHLFYVAIFKYSAEWPVYTGLTSINVYEKKCVRLVSDFFSKCFQKRIWMDSNLISLNPFISFSEKSYKQGMLIYQMVIWRLGIISISFQTSEGWGSSHNHLEHMGARGHLTITWSIWRQGGVISHSLEYLNVISHSFGVSEGWGSSYTHLEYMNTGDYLDCIVSYELF